jgi:NitT/TauT family transport system substrate-binding protein
MLSSIIGGGLMPRVPRLTSLIAIASLSFAVASLQPSARAAEPLTPVQYSSLGGATDAGIYLADALGFFREQGIAVTTNLMINAPSQIAEMATGRLDVSGIALSPGIFAASTRNIGLRIVGDKQSLRPGFSSTRILARPEFIKATEEETVRGLRGRRMAGPGRTTIGYYLVASLFRKYGMDVDDFDFVEIPLPDIVAGLAAGAADGALVVEPIGSRAVKAGIAKEVSDCVEFVPPGGSATPLVYSEQFARKRDVAMGFMRAYMRGARVFVDAFAKGKDRDRVINIIAEHAKIPAEIVRDAFPGGLDPNQRISKDFLAKVQTFYIERKLLEKPADLDTLVDMSFADAALKDLGEYQ